LKRSRFIRRPKRLLAAPVLALALGACTPSLSILNPTPDATVAGVVQLDNEVTPDAQAGLDSVDANIDGTSIALNANHDGAIDTEAVSNGKHTVTVNATNRDGTTTKSVTVNVQNPPIPGSVGVVGDSVSYNSFNSTGSPYEPTIYGDAPPDRLLDYWLGYKVPDSQPAVEQWTAQRRPQILVIADGINDARPNGNGASGDGYTQTDRNHVVKMISTVHTSACIVLVKPGWGSGLGTTTFGQTYITQLQLVRDYYDQLDAERVNVIVVDWLTIATEHPEYMDPDGIHLAQKADGSSGWDIAAATARQVMYWDGVNACQALLAGG
jgi:hypothetical protein